MTGPAPVRVSTPTDTTIAMTRLFHAPRRLVFDAWTKPELLARWYGAHGWTIAACTIDLRVGGAYRLRWRGPAGATMACGGRYRRIDPPAALAYTETFDEHWYPGQGLVSHQFTQLAEDRTRLETTLELGSRQARDLVLASPMDRGVARGYERLDALLHQTSKERT